MKPDEPNSQSGMSLSQQGPLANTPNYQTSSSNQEAAANVIRSQIDNIYSHASENPQPAATVKKIDKGVRKYICLQQPTLVQPTTLPTINDTQAVPAKHPAWDDADLIRKTLCGGN